MRAGGGMLYIYIYIYIYIIFILATVASTKLFDKLSLANKRAQRITRQHVLKKLQLKKTSKDTVLGTNVFLGHPVSN